MLTYTVPQPGVTGFVEPGIRAVKYLLTNTHQKKGPKPTLLLFLCEASSENVNHIKLTLRAKENRQLDSIPLAKKQPLNTS